MPQKITKAVFPAAGFGTRFLPVTKAQPKEMLPIVDKPVIQYLVEEAVESGIKEIIIVTGRGKRSIEDHFDDSFELEYNLVEKGKHNLLKEVRKISQLAKFIYVRQPKPLGDGHAILCAKEVIGNEPFAVLFGDDLVDSEVPALKQLMNVYEKTGSSIIALEKINKKDTDKYGIIKAKNSQKIYENESKKTANRHQTKKLFSKIPLYEIESFIEKPKPQNAPSNLGIIGKYILTPEILNILEKTKPGPDGEIRLINGLMKLKNEQKIYGVEIQGTRYDTGTKFGFLKATIDFSLKRNDLGPSMRSYLKTLDL
ncbi:UTP--glucose-1-phosphate uridylyltransferase GalU [Candidatus Peregrinibacteria bacterium]|nr:UTP--glucose-1-phosphate uridylyltransferase GalU [Candidatus Peregrinibacteria bacterium]